MCFWVYGVRKTWLDKCLISLVWEDPFTGNMVNGPKHWFNINVSSFTKFIDQFKVIELEKVTLRDMQSLNTVC